jgi:hypothetical protein
VIKSSICGTLFLLGRERYEPSVPTLTRLWKDCALQPAWVAVGHALFKIATPKAMVNGKSAPEADLPSSPTNSPQKAPSVESENCLELTLEVQQCAVA